MFDFRPVGYIIGLLVTMLGVTMFLPAIMDFSDGSYNWTAFALSALITILIGSGVALACQNTAKDALNIQQTFVLTTGIWLILPIFAAFPFLLGAPHVRFVDGFFEAMSGLTTTGSTVFSGLDALPRGVLLWRGLMQWFGGIGVVVVAMVFLPVLRVGGMQIFKTEGFDTFGKILPRVAEISRSIAWVYLLLTAVCMFFYVMAGLNLFDAFVHAMTTIATGGFANYDTSFNALGAQAEYVAVIFMLLSALPFIRYVQLTTGSVRPLFNDPQIRTFLGITVIIIMVLFMWLFWQQDHTFSYSLRKAAFNGVSILTGTGYVSADYMLWGSFPIVFIFLIGFIGGCAGSTTCSIKVFRFQLLFASILTQIKRIHSPNGIFIPRYNHQRVAQDVINSVMAFFMLFMVTLAILAVALGMTGLDTITAITGAIAALGNIGPGLGSEIGPSGNFSMINDTAKWMLAFAMLLGRLELMAVYVLLMGVFWRG